MVQICLLSNPRGAFTNFDEILEYWDEWLATVDYIFVMIWVTTHIWEFSKEIFIIVGCGWLYKFCSKLPKVIG